MIRHLGNEDLSQLMLKLRQSPFLTVRIASLLMAYGAGRPFFDIWAQDHFRAVLARLDTVFFAYLQKEPDESALSDSAIEEMACFIAFSPHFQILAGEDQTVRRIAGFIKKPYSLQTRNFLRLPGDHLPLLHGQAALESPPRIESRPDLKKVFDVITACSGTPLSFAPWYVDLSHRIRHGCARAYLLMGEKPACACLISAESDYAGLISGVATLPAYRHNGFARAVIARACADLIRSGKTPVLECTDELRLYYESLGFELYARTAELVCAD